MHLLRTIWRKRRYAFVPCNERHGLSHLDSLDFGPLTAIAIPGHDALTSLEYGFAFLHKRLGRIAMIFGLSAMYMVRRFEIQTVVNVSG
jgi:hypothetical protein